MMWFRWHHGTTSDPKFRRVARNAGASLVEVIAVWAALLEHASEADDRGSIAGLDLGDVAAGLDIDDETVAAILEAMEAKGMVGDGRVTHWEKRQPNGANGGRDHSTERVKAYRDRQRVTAEVSQAQAEQAVTAPEPEPVAVGEPEPVSNEAQMKRDETQRNADETHGNDQRREEQINTLSPSHARAHEEVPEGGGQAVAATLPEGWTVPDAWVEQARTEFPGVDVVAEAAKFPAWHREHGSRRSDWRESWRLWLLRAWPAKGVPPTGQGRRDGVSSGNRGTTHDGQDSRRDGQEYRSSAGRKADAANRGLYVRLGLDPDTGQPISRQAGAGAGQDEQPDDGDIWPSVERVYGH